jgi:signal transduction histidine kinase
MNRLRILNLEDDPLDAELVRTMLEEGDVGCEVVLVQTGDDFVAALEENDFDLILADYALPGFDGMTALEISREKKPGLPFIFVSGTMGEEFAIEAVKSGATDYVLKQRLSRLAPAVHRAVREAEERAARLRAEEALQEIRAAERARIARDLHDVVLQDMAYVLQGLEIAQISPDMGGATSLQRLAGTLRNAVLGVREAIHDLHPQELRGKTLPGALGELLAANRRMAPELRTQLVVETDFPTEVPEDTGREVLRIVQEALANVRRHARAGRVTVTLSAEDEGIRIEVSDDGEGFAPAKASGGLGTVSMRERAVALGGRLEIESSPGGGTRVIFAGPHPA